MADKRIKLTEHRDRRSRRASGKLPANSCYRNSATVRDAQLLELLCDDSSGLFLLESELWSPLQPPAELDESAACAIENIYDCSLHLRSIHDEQCSSPPRSFGRSRASS